MSTAMPVLLHAGEHVDQRQLDLGEQRGAAALARARSSSASARSSTARACSIAVSAAAVVVAVEASKLQLAVVGGASCFSSRLR